MAIQIFSDGACSGNPGPGGYAALVVWNGGERMVSGGESHTTNNRMELMGAIAALELMKAGRTVVLTTDSRYVMDGIEKWIPGWKRRGWKTAGGEPVKNQDLWQRLDAACQGHAITWTWVKGHNGHPENERVDQEAQRQSQLFKANIAQAASPVRPRGP